MSGAAEVFFPPTDSLNYGGSAEGLHGGTLPAWIRPAFVFQASDPRAGAFVLSGSPRAAPGG